MALALLAACAHAPGPAPVAPVAADPPAQVKPDAGSPAPDPQADARAEAAFRALEPQFDALVGQRFEDAKRMKAAMTERLRSRQQLERAYQGVIQLGSVQWTIACWARLGELDHDLAQALQQAAAPAGLTAEQLEIYRSELRSFARPILTKAIESYRKALAAEEKSGARSEWGDFARAQLAQLDPSP